MTRPLDKNALFRLGVAHRMRHESPGGNPVTSRQPSMPGAVPWSSTQTSTSGVVASSNTARAWPSHTRSTTGSRSKGGDRPPRRDVLPPRGRAIRFRARRPSPRRRGGAGRPVEPDPKGQIPGINSGSSRPRWSSYRRVSVRARRRGYTSPSARTPPSPGTGTTNPARYGSGSPRPRAGHFGTIARSSAAGPARVGLDPPSRLRGQGPATATGRTRLPAYALYNTCEQAGGRCLFLRQDLSVELDVAK